MSQGQKFYAVHNGREGTQIYLTWKETKANVNRVPRVIYKSFRSLGEAQAWLQGIADATAVDAPPPYYQTAGQAQAGEPVQPHPPPPVQRVYSEPGPSRLGGSGGGSMNQDEHSQFDDSMDVDDYSDIEFLPGPPPSLPSSSQSNTTRRAPSPEQDYFDNFSDIEILAGPPANMQISRARSHASSALPARTSSQAPSEQVQARAPSQALRDLPAVNKVEETRPHAAPEGILAPAPVQEIELSPDQLFVLSKVKNGESVFFTGSAGTGKSVLLREIIKYCGGRPSLRLGVTASTGIASVNIGGCTLHSWAGIGLGKEDKDALVGKILGISAKAYKEDRMRREELKYRRNRGEQLTPEEKEFLKLDPSETCKNNLVNRWKRCKTLIIDEISMIDGKLFDKLEYVGRKLRNKELPFGGIQLVLSGDFCQLPPVPDKSPKGGQIPATFAFDAESWNRCVGPPIVLTKVFRQKDQRFVDMLNSMRFGVLDEHTTRTFYNLKREVKYDDGIEPTELYPTRAQVESANTRRLDMLPGNPRKYTGLDHPGRDPDGKPFPHDRVERALKDVICPKVLPLKEGAQVMLLKNIIQGVLVNGSLGRVVGFYKPRDALAMGAQIALPESREQANMRVEMESAVAGTKDAAPGDGFGADFIPLPQSTQADKVQAEMREQKLKSILALNTVWPAVQFTNGMLMLCVPLTFEVINADAVVEAVREQVPLMLAWALSMHKSQGQTLERVRVDLGRIFEKGQAYVALSRATRMESLQVLHFDPAKVQAHPRVLQWMAENRNSIPRIPDPPYIPDEIDEELEYWADIL